MPDGRPPGRPFRVPTTSAPPRRRPVAPCAPAHPCPVCRLPTMGPRSVCPAHTPVCRRTALPSWLMSTPADSGASSFQIDLTGRTAMVTGAASGIGAACAQRLAAAGAHVVAVDRDEAGLAALTAGTDIEARPCDLADLDAVSALPAAVDVLVNNAGIQHVAPIQDFPPERFDLIIRLMLQSPFRLVQQVLPHMYDAGWGRVVNVS